MVKRITKRPETDESGLENTEIEFILDDVQPVSSGEMLRVGNDEETAPAIELETDDSTAAADDIELSPAFKQLALPKLPALEKENRARLQVQSPNRLFFYWSLRTNPFQALNRALGTETGGYTLALRLVDVDRESEELHAVDAEGSWWFNADADSKYRAEIGLFSPSRPFIRILFSNTVTTPRKSPSPRAATSADWKVSSNQFAQVLDVAGFEQDAFDVAIAGDDVAASDNASHIAFSRFIGESEYSLDGISAEDIRFAMMAIAAGQKLEELRWKIGAALFAILQANADRLDAEKAAAALTEYFDIDEAEFTEEEFGSAVYGASLVHFPKKFKTRPRGEYSPISSFSIGGR